MKHTPEEQVEEQPNEAQDTQQLKETMQMRMLMRMEKQLSRSERRDRRSGLFKRIKLGLILLGIAAAIILIIWAVNAFTLPSFLTRSNNRGGGSGVTLSTTHGEIYSIILGEARATQMLIVLEQNVEVTSALATTPLINWDVFRKVQTVTSVGTGVFTVDMQQITQSSISIDEATQVISIAIPQAQLSHVNVDTASTTVSDIERGFLAFGEIQMTMEEQQALNESIVEAMRDKLSEPDTLAIANETAVAQISDLYQTLINVVHSGYAVHVSIEEPASQ